MAGGIDPKAFPYLIAHLHRQGATGSLKVDGPSYQKAIYFRGGRVLFGSSNDPKDQLGAILIESGRISPEQLEEVNAKVGPGNPLAKVLSDSGFVSQRELSEAARVKVERILSDVLSYDTGSFEFEDGVLPKGAVDLKLSSEKLFLAAVRRVSDRNFVLRHLQSLEVMLTPGVEFTRVLAEVEADFGPALRLFDGRRTVKDVAAEARLDEFDAAKAACGLLFLAAVERSTSDLLDLGATARAAVETPHDISADATLLVGDDAPPLMINDPEPEYAPLPQTEADAMPAPASALMIEAEEDPAASSPDATRPDADMTEVRPGYRSAPSSASTPPAYTPAAFEEPVPPPAAAAPPSKEDLAALDALLNARNVEGPLAPMAKPVEPNWEPHFGGRRGGRPAGRVEGGESRRTMLLSVAAVLVLAGAFLTAWAFLFRPSPPTKPTLDATPLAAPTTLPPATTLPLEPPGSVVAATPETSLPTPAPVTTPLVSPTQPPISPPQPTPAPGVGDAREAFRRGDYVGAARGFEATLRAAGRGAHTIQILVACSDETLQKAQQNAPNPELFIVPVAYQGKSCYRLCWGVFDSEARARSATDQVPPYFRENGAKPKPVTSASILP
ncbi:MAG TPA: DUF4388 domain-containing protein [Vicinamibacteria bacterium]|nr:DUF4388 domain-containing protein [Vicinamibacteria bacterium]